MVRLIQNILMIAGIIYVYQNKDTIIPVVVNVSNTVIATVGKAVQYI